MGRKKQAENRNEDGFQRTMMKKQIIGLSLVWASGFVGHALYLYNGELPSITYALVFIMAFLLTAGVLIFDNNKHNQKVQA